MNRRQGIGLAVALALASPAFGAEGLEAFLTEAGMTFTLQDTGGTAVYEIRAPGGATFQLRRIEDGYSLALPDANAVTPASGDWGRIFRVTDVECGGSEEEARAILGGLASMERVLNLMLGSRDQGRTAPYSFTAPFAADQLLGPTMEALRSAGIESDVTYEPGRDNVHTVKGVLSQESDADFRFVLELGVLGPDLVWGTWRGSSAPGRGGGGCAAHGALAWCKPDAPGCATGMAPPGRR